MDVQMDKQTDIWMNRPEQIQNQVGSFHTQKHCSQKRSTAKRFVKLPAFSKYFTEYRWPDRRTYRSTNSKIPYQSFATVVYMTPVLLQVTFAKGIGCNPSCFKFSQFLRLLGEKRRKGRNTKFILVGQRGVYYKKQCQ